MPAETATPLRPRFCKSFTFTSCKLLLLFQFSTKPPAKKQGTFSFLCISTFFSYPHVLTGLAPRRASGKESMTTDEVTSNASHIFNSLSRVSLKIYIHTTKIYTVTVYRSIYIYIHIIYMNMYIIIYNLLYVILYEYSYHLSL